MVQLGRVAAMIPGVRALLSAPCAMFARRRAQPKFAAIPTWLGSLEGMYFLRRSLFLPDELPILMGEELAREGLGRLGGTPPGMRPAHACDDTAAVGLLESVHYLRNQLLRDSDWASMGHSLELRTPLVDVKLLEALGPSVSRFVGGAGKAMLARSPDRPLPEAIIKRPKTGFGVPMAAWLADTVNYPVVDSDLPLLAAPGTPWARRWARALVREMSLCE